MNGHSYGWVQCCPTGTSGIGPATASRACSTQIGTAGNSSNTWSRQVLLVEQALVVTITRVLELVVDVPQ